MPYLLTKTKLFFDKIRKNKHIQIILGVLPGLFCFLFTSAFLVDTLNAFGTISINSTYVAEAQENNMFFDVDSYNSTLNLIKSKDTFTVTPDREGFVCNVEVSGLGFSLHNDLQRAFISELIFVDYDATEDLYYINGGEEGIIEPRSEILCKVYYQDEKFVTNDGYQIKEIEGPINFKANEDGTVDVIPAYYEPVPESSTLYFVNCLDDTDLHYDGIENIYVRNVTNDFLKNFLVGSHILIFVLIIILYVCALIYANKQYHIEYFTSKPVIVVNIVGMSALILGVLLAVILLI